MVVVLEKEGSTRGGVYIGRANILVFHSERWMIHRGLRGGN